MEIYCPHCEHEFESDEWEGICLSCGAEWWKEESWDEEMSWYEIYWY